MVACERVIAKHFHPEENSLPRCHIVYIHTTFDIRQVLLGDSMASTITHSVRDGFHVYQVADGVDYWQLYRDFRDGKGESASLPQQTLNRTVSLIEYKGKSWW